MKHITVIGAGTMGSGIAHLFAQYKFKVSLVDVSQNLLDNAIVSITQNLDRQITKGIINLESKQKTLDNIFTFSDLKEGVLKADLVIEAATENLDVKLSLFKEMDLLCLKNTIIATNTSSISITKLGSVTNRPDKVIGMHFMNPVPIINLIEVIRGYNTSNETTQVIMDLSKNLQKTPVEVKDYPGFVANRILMPMINESIYTLYENIATRDDIDQVMKLGLAHPMGPLQLADFIGLDVCLAILKILHEGFGNPKYAPCPLLINMVTSGKLGRKTKEGFYKYE